MGEFEPGWLLRDARRASKRLEQWRLRQMEDRPEDDDLYDAGYDAGFKAGIECCIQGRGQEIGETEGR